MLKLHKLSINQSIKYLLIYLFIYIKAHATHGIRGYNIYINTYPEMISWWMFDSFTGDEGACGETKRI